MPALQLIYFLQKEGIAYPNGTLGGKLFPRNKIHDTRAREKKNAVVHSFRRNMQVDKTRERTVTAITAIAALLFSNLFAYAGSTFRVNIISRVTLILILGRNFFT